MPQAMKIPDEKAAVDKEWKKLESNPAWQLEKVKSKNVTYTSLIATISHDNNNHRRAPFCLGGSSDGWVPVKTQSTPVPTSVERVWVAHQLHNTQQ